MAKDDGIANESHGRDPLGSGGPAPVAPPPEPAGPLVEALGWLAERLVETTIEPEAEPAPSGQDWGLGGGWFAPSYWHWIHQWDLARTGDADTLPPVATASEGPLLSVVVPVYKPRLWYFRECVASVIRQTYGNWELCLCDDGSADPALTEVMEEFAAGDPRVKVMALEQNGGISRATNRALEAASGEFVVLLDHDDVLEPDALAEVVVAIASGDDVDVVYSDEDKLDELDRRYLPMFKPDWDPDLLLVYPYLGHLTVIRRDIVVRIGGFRTEFDGSQDYDMMLRATELARRVVHVPKVLYHWRAVPGSAALDPEAKPWAHRASRRVVEDAVRRRGIDGWVEDGPFQGAYHVRRRIEGAPTVSVIIPFRDQAALTVACLASLEDDPGYPIHEVVLVDNGSTDPETRALRRQLEDASGHPDHGLSGGVQLVDHQQSGRCHLHVGHVALHEQRHRGHDRGVAPRPGGTRPTPGGRGRRGQTHLPGRQAAARWRRTRVRWSCGPHLHRHAQGSSGQRRLGPDGPRVQRGDGGVHDGEAGRLRGDSADSPRNWPSGTTTSTSASGCDWPDTAISTRRMRS